MPIDTRLRWPIAIVTVLAAAASVAARAGVVASPPAAQMLAVRALPVMPASVAPGRADLARVCAGSGEWVYLGRLGAPFLPCPPSAGAGGGGAADESRRARKTSR